MTPKPRILLVSTVPSTLWAFYRRMPEYARARGMELAVAASPEKELAFFADECGVATHAVEMPRRVSPLRDALSIRQLSRIIRRERYDIVHAFTSKAGLVGMSAGVLARTPHRIYSMLGLPAETATGITRRLLVGSETAASRMAHQVLACSDSLSRRIQELGICGPDKLSVLADGTCCGVNARMFVRTPEVSEGARARRQKLGIPLGAPVMGFVGRLVHDKGIHTTVDAFVTLSEKRPDAHLLLLGDYEPHRGEVPAHTVRQIEAHPRIHHANFDWDPIPYYAAMDVLVLASYREGFPYALLEAACMEIPAVTTRATGCIDAVVDGQTGYLIDVEDDQALASAVDRLLADPALRQRLGQDARRRVEDSFTDDRLLDEHFKLYESLLNKR